MDGQKNIGINMGTYTIYNLISYNLGICLHPYMLQEYRGDIHGGEHTVRLQRKHRGKRLRITASE